MSPRPSSLELPGDALHLGQAERDATRAEHLKGWYDKDSPDSGPIAKMVKWMLRTASEDVTDAERLQAVATEDGLRPRGITLSPNWRRRSDRLHCPFCLRRSGGPSRSRIGCPSVSRRSP